jgi:hypothetical protein
LPAPQLLRNLPVELNPIILLFTTYNSPFTRLNCPDAA